MKINKKLSTKRECIRNFLLLPMMKHEHGEYANKWNTNEWNETESALCKKEHGNNIKPS